MSVHLIHILFFFFNSEDEDAPSPLTRRLSSLNLSRRSSASSIQSSSTPPLTSTSSFRRIHPLSRSYSSGAILETEREHDGSFDEYSPSSYLYDYDEDEEEEEEEEDHTIEETGNWAQRYRLGGGGGQHPTSPPQRHHRQFPPPSTSTTRSRTRKNHQIQTTTSNYSRTSTGSVGSGFSLEVTIPEGGEERSKTPSRLRRPSSHTSFKSSSIGVVENGGSGGGGGGRDSSGSSSLDSRFSSGFSSQQDGSNSNNNQNNNNGVNGNTPSSTSSTLSIPMPSTPKDIFNPAAPPMMSSRRGSGSIVVGVLNKEKSLPPLPAGGLKKKLSGNLQQRSILSSSSGRNSVTSTTASGRNSLNASTTTTGMVGTGKYAFPTTSRIRTFSSTSVSTPPLPSSPSTSPTIPSAAPGVLTPSSSAVTIKPTVRPLQLPRQSSINRGDRPAVPVPSPTTLHSPTSPTTLRSPTLHSPLTTNTNNNNNTLNNSLRAPTTSLSTLQQRRPTPITPILLGHSGTISAPASPAIIINSGATTPTTGGSMTGRPKPRTGTGMVYRTSSYGVGGGGGGGGGGSKMRAPMILSGSASLVSGGNGGNGGGTGSFSGAIAL